MLRRFQFVSAGIAMMLLTMGALATTAGASDFEFDPGFGKAGVTVTDDWGISDVAADRRGRTVFAGFFGGVKYFAFYVVRLKANGGLDHSFGYEGGAGAGPSNVNQFAEAVATQPDGKVLAAGFAQHGDFGRSGPLLFRFKTDGKLDRTFRAGFVQDFRGNGLRDVISVGGGKVLAAGFRNAYSRKGTPAATVMKFETDGSRDRGFGKRGTAALEYRGGDEVTVANDLVPLASGKYLVSGYLGDRAFVARLHRDGRLDRSFAGNGIQRFRSHSVGNCSPESPCGGDPKLALTPTGEIRWLVHRAKDGKRRSTAVIVGLTQNGTPDRGFGRDGTAVVRSAGLGPLRGHGILIRDGGGIVVLSSANERAFAIGLKADGSSDRAFGPRGRFELAGKRGPGGVLVSGDRIVVGSSGPKNRSRFQRLVPAGQGG